MRAASARVQSHPPASTPPAAIENDPHRPELKAKPDTPAREPGRRRTPAPDQPGPAQPESKRDEPKRTAPAGEDAPRPPAPRGPSVDEVENDPLVKSVLDVFGGEIKRIHPKNQ